MPLEQTVAGDPGARKGTGAGDTGARSGAASGDLGAKSQAASGDPAGKMPAAGTDPKTSTAETGPEIDVPVSVLDGFQYLHNGEFNKALETFNRLARERPDSAEAHYGRARALTYLGRKEDAIKEYKVALLLSPVDELAKLCNEQLSALSKAPEKRHSSGTLDTLRTQDVEGSISKILRQSEEKIHNIQSSSETYATNVYNARADAHNRLMEQARLEAEEMRLARYRRGRRFSEAEIQQRQAELQYKSASLLERSKADFEQRKNEAESRSLGVKQSAEGLESQMINKPSETSGVFLVPTGTNLYVRNYAHFDPVMPEPPQALHAVPVKLPQVQKMSEEENKKKEKGAHKSPAPATTTP